MQASKNEYLNQLKKQYDDLNYRWNRERDRMEAKLQHESAEFNKEFEAKREEYRKFREEVREAIIKLETAGDNAWGDLKQGAQTSWDELMKAYDKAVKRF
jgi:hypothetical protein